MMNHLLLFTTIFLLLLSYISCVSLPPAYKLGCIILPKNQKIYCYGGATKQPNAPSSAIFKDDKFYNDLYSLDVSKPLNINGSNTQWELIPPPNDFVHEGRADFAMVAYNDTAFLISSGNGPTSDFKNPGLVNVTVRYNTEFNSWKAVKALDPLSPKMNISLDTQMFGSRAAQVNGTFLFFSGGNSPDNNTVVQTDSQLVTYKAESPTWETVLVTTIVIRPGGVISPFTSRFHQHALATARNEFVYFFGGVAPQNATNNYAYESNLGFYTFKSLLTYAPGVNNSFKITDCNNSPQIPDGRVLHTATLIPNTDNILIYGGKGSEGALPDYCWIFDTNQKTYKQCSATNNGPGPRYGHAAVMVGSESLYIIGGTDIEGNVNGDVNILNVTSMTWINGTFTNTYDQGLAAAAGVSNGSSGLSGGAIAGAVIGGIAGAAIIIAGAVFFYLSRKKKKMYEAGEAPQGFDAGIAPAGFNEKYHDNTNHSEGATEITSPTVIGSVHTFKPDSGNYDQVSAAVQNEKPHMY